MIVMPRHERYKSKTGFYHIMMRGNERKNIFIDQEDKLRFLETLDFKKQETDMSYMHSALWTTMSTC